MMKIFQLARSVVFFGAIIVLTLCYWPVAVAVYRTEPKFRSRAIGWWAHIVIWLLAKICGLRHEVEGLENLPARACVIFAKHQSAWETIAFQTIFPPQAWVLKRSLLRIPFFGWGLAATGPIKIDRSTSRKAIEEVVSQGKKVLSEGRYVVIFPEGTRIAPGQHGTYHASASLLAVRSNVPVVPVAHNAGDFWRRRELAKRSGVIQVRVGQPIDSENRKPRDVNREAEEWIRETMPQISAAYLPYSGAAE